MSRDAMKTHVTWMCPAALKMQTRKTARKMGLHKPVTPKIKMMRIVDALDKEHAYWLSPFQRVNFQGGWYPATFLQPAKKVKMANELLPFALH
jgi:hypothetical protein